jgi:hypothetical protein
MAGLKSSASDKRRWRFEAHMVGSCGSDRLGSNARVSRSCLGPREHNSQGRHDELREHRDQRQHRPSQLFTARPPGDKANERCYQRRARHRC